MYMWIFFFFKNIFFLLFSIFLHFCHFILAFIVPYMYTVPVLAICAYLASPCHEYAQRCFLVAFQSSSIHTHTHTQKSLYDFNSTGYLSALQSLESQSASNYACFWLFVHIQLNNTHTYVRIYRVLLLRHIHKCPTDNSHEQWLHPNTSIYTSILIYAIGHICHTNALLHQWACHGSKRQCFFNRLHKSASFLTQFFISSFGKSSKQSSATNNKESICCKHLLPFALLPLAQFNSVPAVAGLLRCSIVCIYVCISCLQRLSNIFTIAILALIVVAVIVAGTQNKYYFPFSA